MNIKETIIFESSYNNGKILMRPGMYYDLGLFIRGEMSFEEFNKMNNARLEFLKNTMARGYDVLKYCDASHASYQPEIAVDYFPYIKDKKGFNKETPSYLFLKQYKLEEFLKQYPKLRLPQEK